MKFKDVEKKLFKNKKFAELYHSRRNNRIIGRNILRIRLETGLSQKKLADLIDTKQPAITRIENGDTNLTVLTLQKIADALNTKIADLLPKEEKTTEEFKIDYTQCEKVINISHKWKLIKISDETNNEFYLSEQNSLNINLNLGE